MGFEWDCDCGWEFEGVDVWSPPPPPPLFDLPPPPLPPSLVTSDQVCALDTPLADTCQAFLVTRASLKHPSSNLKNPGMSHIILNAIKSKPYVLEIEARASRIREY